MLYYIVLEFSVNSIWIVLTIIMKNLKSQCNCVLFCKKGKKRGGERGEKGRGGEKKTKKKSSPVPVLDLKNQSSSSFGF